MSDLRKLFKQIEKFIPDPTPSDNPSMKDLDWILLKILPCGLNEKAEDLRQEQQRRYLSGEKLLCYNLWSIDRCTNEVDKYGTYCEDCKIQEFKGE